MRAGDYVDPTYPCDGSAGVRSSADLFTSAGLALRPGAVRPGYGTQIQPVVVVSFTATSTRRYLATTVLCLTTSSKNQDEAITARTPGDPARAALSGSASSSRNARLIEAAVTPCSS